jgi:hypothetical protein
LGAKQGPLGCNDVDSFYSSSAVRHSLANRVFFLNTATAVLSLIATAPTRKPKFAKLEGLSRSYYSHGAVQILRAPTRALMGNGNCILGNSLCILLTDLGRVYDQ